MFTGIIEAVGEVMDVRADRLRVRVEEYPNNPVTVGESVAVNGCCLTAVEVSPLTFDLSEETLRKTALADLRCGDRVNIERAMRADGRFGGHLVQGHVDATGTLAEIEETDQARRLRFHFPVQFSKYMIEKGSITVNGISLTIVDLEADSFDVWIIPHTWTHTNLGTLKLGDRVNLEFDVLAKYLERLVDSSRPV